MVIVEEMALTKTIKKEELVIIGRNIARKRAELNLRQPDLAHITGKKVTSLSEKELAREMVG